MPRPVEKNTAYLPGLDGIRALAVAFVILYHLDVPGFQGGLLGVGIFFTLSGFLITGVLIGGWQRRGDWGLRTFWLRRARRLLPAVVLVLATSMATVLLVDRADAARRAGEAFSALFYFANWHTIYAGDSYFTQVNGPGPFDHLWSLSVEEQYYLVWPLLLAALVAIFRRRLRLVAAATAALAAGSFVLLVIVAQPGMDNTRAYEGTDTRAGALLLGASLALLWYASGRRVGDESAAGRRHRWAWDLVGLAGLAGTGYLVAGTNENRFALYQWGLVLLAVCTVGLLVAVSHPATVLARVFGIAPLRWLGERSYGIYLWHLPVIVFTPDGALAADPALRAAGQVGLTVLLAALSWHFVEDPIRRLGFRQAFGAAGAGVLGGPVDSAQAGKGPPDAAERPGARRRVPVLFVGTPIVLAAAMLAMLLPGALPRQQPAEMSAPQPVGLRALGPTAAGPAGGPAGAATDPNADAPPTTGPSPSAGPPTSTLSPSAMTKRSSQTPSGKGNASAGSPSQIEMQPSDTPSSPPAVSTSGPSSPVEAASPRTRCESVIEVGDSTSEGLYGTRSSLSPTQNLKGQLEQVGVRVFSAEISGARSIIESYKGEPSGEDVIRAHVGSGYRGCWIIALGNVDAATVAKYAPATTSIKARIAKVMTTIPADAPVLWLTTRTIKTGGDFRASVYPAWNQGLAAACPSHPNMRVFDWAGAYQNAWFGPDGIHPTVVGYQHKAHLMAQALAEAFPAGGASSPGCVISVS